MSTRGTRHDRSRSSGGRGLAVFLVFVVAVVGVVLSLTVFFKVTRVQVEGQYSVYTEEEILAVANIEVGSNLPRLPVKDIATRLESDLPYLLGVTVRRSLPDTVVITVNDIDTELALPYSGGCLIISDGLKILRDERSLPGGYTEVYGISPVDISVGNRLQVDDEEGTLYLETVIEAAREEGLLTGITAINVSDKLNLCLIFDNRVFVLLGTASEIDYKFRMLGEVMEAEGRDAAGNLDVSMPGKAYFAPGDMEVPDGFYSHTRLDMTPDEDTDSNSQGEPEDDGAVEGLDTPQGDEQPGETDDPEGEDDPESVH